MKQEINIYTNIKNNKFFEQILPNYTLNFKNINELLSNPLTEDSGGIIINKDLSRDGLNINNLKESYLVVTCEKNLAPLKNNIKIIKAPAFPYQIKSNIENFLNNNSLKIGDLLIINQKINNLKKNKSYPLTEIENKILMYLIDKKLCTKEDIKENILNIKSTIETNSIESHLTRIRKKLDSIDTKFKIRSKKNIISIDIS